MKPPSDKMGGGYRRKADQDTLGRNSRLRYSYLASDPRMIPYSSARLRENQNKPIGRTLQADMGEGTVAANIEMAANGLLPNSYSRLFDVLVTDISALSATNLRIEAEIEILANPVLGTPAHTQTVLLATNIGRAFLQSRIDSTGFHRFISAEYQIDIARRQKLFEARRVRVLFYDNDGSSPVLDRTTAFTEYFCYSPVVGIGSTINASINYSTPNNTVFDSANNSATAKIVTRFDNFAFTGDSDNQNFQLRFDAQSTTGTPTKVFYATSHVFNPNIGLTGVEVELLQPDGPIYENYSVNNHDVDFFPVAWPSVVKKQLGYGWDPAWDSAASVSPSVITTFYINYAVVKLVAGNTASNNVFKFFDIQMDSIAGTDFANVGARILGDYTIETLRSGQSNYSTVASNIQQSPLNPAATTPATLHNNALRTLGNPADDIRGPIVANLYTTWSYTNTEVMNFYDMFNAIAVPPYFDSISMAIQNETQAGYDIVVTAYDGFTAFNQNGASGETPYITCELYIRDSASATVLYQDLNIQLTGYSLSNTPFTVKQVDRSTGSPDLSWFPKTFTGGHSIDINLNYTFATSGYSSFLQTQILNSQVTAPFALYSASNLLSTIQFSPYHPDVTGFTADIANPSNFAYDIRLTSFTGFTAFTGNENPEYTFDLIFRNGSTTVHTETVTWDTSVYPPSSLPYVLYTTDRAFTDAAWWTHNSTGSHTIEIVLKYVFTGSAYTHTYNLNTSVGPWGYNVFTYLDGYFYNQAYFAIMIRTDAQNSQSYSMLNATEVNYIADLSGNVQGNAGHSRLARKGTTYSSTSIPRMTKTTTINGHDSFDGWCTWGWVTSNTYTGNTSNGDVPKYNNDESYTMVQVFQYLSYGGAWSPLSVYYLGNGNRGVVTTRWGTSTNMKLAIGTSLTSSDFANVPTNTPMVLITRCESLSGGTGQSYNMYIDAMRISDGVIIHSSMLNDSDTLVSIFNNATAGAYFIGCNEFGAGTAAAQFPTTGVNPNNYIWGENILYNKFLSNQQTSQLLTELRNKWM